MALEVNEIGGATVVAAAEEVVLSDLVQRGGTREGRDMTAHVGMGICLYDHRHRVPANVRLDLPFHLHVPRIGRLLVRGNRVDVRGAGDGRDLVTLRAQILDEVGDDQLLLLRGFPVERETGDLGQ